MTGSDESWKALRRSAISGDPDAEFKVGLKYDNGFSDNEGNMIVRQNPRRAVFWYRRSAEHGNPSGQNSLGYCLDIGRGVRKNKEEALYWYKKAFENGDPCAANNIATIYGERGNNRRSFFWYLRAAEAGDGDALTRIGQRYYDGSGVRRNYHLAVEYYKKAIDSDHITEAGRQDAMYYLGLAFFEGKGVEKSLPVAKEWFQDANADGDHTRAIHMLDEIDKLLSDSS